MCFTFYLHNFVHQHFFFFIGFQCWYEFFGVFTGIFGEQLEVPLVNALEVIAAIILF